jgi:hypothetical protein
MDVAFEHDVDQERAFVIESLADGRLDLLGPLDADRRHAH